MTLAELDEIVAEAKSAQNAKENAAGVVTDAGDAVTDAQATLFSLASDLAAQRLAIAQAALVVFVNSSPEIIEP